MLSRKEAGRSARAIYKARVRRWLWRNWKAVLISAGSIWLLAGVVVFFAWPLGAGDFLAGMYVGLALTFSLTLPQLAPNHIRNWERGVFGEEWTEKALRPLLRDGWHVVHDRAGRLGNIDHVLVGRPGVFLLDSKFWAGEAIVERGSIVVRRLDEDRVAYVDERLIDAMKAAAAWLHGELTKRGVRPGWVNPVVVMWAGVEPSPTIADGVTVINGKGLAEWLRRHPGDLDPAHIEILATAIRTLPAAPLPADPSPA